MKGWCIYRRSPGKRVHAVMTVFIDRVLGLVSLMLVGTVAVLIQKRRPELAGISQIASTILLIILVGGLIFFSGRLRKLLKVNEMLSRLPMGRQVRALDDSLFHYRSHVWVMVSCVAISFLVHLWTVFSVYYLGRALDLHVGLGSYFIFLPVIFTGGAFIPSIAGLGVLEGLFQHFFSMKGVGATPSSAVALCVLYRIVVLLGSIPGALPTFKEMSASRVPNLSQPDIVDLPDIETEVIGARAAC